MISTNRATRRWPRGFKRHRIAERRESDVAWLPQGKPRGYLHWNM